MSSELVTVGRDYFARDPVELAPLLLGAVLTYTAEDGRVAIRISDRQQDHSAAFPKIVVQYT